jgi:CO dehydrogenase/acetyl-CoA synthase epsilon subunit
MAAGQGKEIPDDKKAVVIAALLTGQGVNQVAAAYKVPKSSVSRLKKLIPKEKLEQVGTQKGENIADLIAKNLESSFAAIQNILDQTGNAEWLNKQPASDLATFLGVTSDKVFRVLEAIENAQGDAPEAD